MVRTGKENMENPVQNPERWALVPAGVFHGRERYGHCSGLEVYSARLTQPDTVKEASLKQDYLNRLVEEIKKVSTFDFPQEIVTEERENRKKQLEQRLQQSGIDLEQYLILTKSNEEDLNKQLEEEARKGLESFFVMDSVGEKEKLNITEEELEFELAKMAEQYNMTVEQIKNALGQQLGQFRHNLIMQKIENFLYENNK